MEKKKMEQKQKKGRKNIKDFEVETTEKSKLKGKIGDRVKW